MYIYNRYALYILYRYVYIGMYILYRYVYIGMYILYRYVYRRYEANGIGTASRPFVMSARYVSQIGGADPVLVSHARFNKNYLSTR
jgi:hypothetical protein